MSRGQNIGVLLVLNTTGNGENVQTSIFGQRLCLFSYLHRQFTSRSEDQNPRRTRFTAWEIEQILQRWDHESRRFTRACWG
ncbi:Uncharacterised protein [Vibrio cholerae]|uniref:Uncharacterized protein n=1 Tax=Vibrio cholerae TaxID=666 RepID=A0A655ZVI7_VIBCL|nr:Uncharacterised protein [Vibrio cholerae]CSC85174.1 Uncharacterised protein [Vibrio cholerae]CSD28287.1 Uncharacterised protein [Vibrio cholerae]